ncbi:hypothetical protein RND81_07G151200 [Saponaria officinalis]|uniref:Dof-type domain-containing protein n=1 Tax=Saponaria officinalis TaxID=3572 RepID=A0AAW1JNK7_SAPOF
MGEIKLFGQKIVLQSKEDSNKNNQRVVEEEENATIHKRPDKIIPCPRCKSMETKFCYFNNYNVNQPRHFCKGCQRYWTAGGALRNVPVGAGRRKAKPLGGGGGFPENCFFEGLNLNMGQFDLNGMVVDEWRLAAVVAAGGGFGSEFQIKRRKSESTG